MPLAAHLPGNASRFRRRLLAWYENAGRRDLPWRNTRDPYAILVSEVMLQQTQVATVLPYYADWLRRFPNFESLAKTDEADVLHAWQGLGYYARARNLQRAARAVMKSHAGALPTSAEQIRTLPGLGRYTANAVATFAFDQAVPVVEANTARCLSRLFDLQIRIDSSEGQKQLWTFATSLLPTRSASRYNSALMDLGALVCVAGEPKCQACPVRSFCRATEPAKLPLKKKRTPTKRLTEHHGFLRRRGRVLLEQSRDRWRGMWILPRLASRPEAQEPIHSAVFPFTHHRVTLEVFDVDDTASSPSRKWFSPRELASTAVPSPHRRALDQLLAV